MNVVRARNYSWHVQNVIQYPYTSSLWEGTRLIQAIPRGNVVEGNPSTFSLTMIATRGSKPPLILGIAALFCVVQSAAVSQNVEVPAQVRQNVPVLVASVHASIVEAPVKSNIVEAPVKSNTGNETDASGFIGKVKMQSGNFFSRISSHNTTKATDDSAGKKSATGAVNESAPEMSPSAESEPLEPSSTDAVTTRMRLTAFLESLSASLEDMRMLLMRGFWESHENPYEIVSRNDTMLIVSVPGRRFYSAPGKHRVVPVRAVFHKKRLTVEIEESSFVERADNASKISEETAGIGTEYHFTINDAYVVIEDIYLRATNKPIPGYEIVIPLRTESKSNGNARMISRTVAKATSPDGDVVQGHWGTAREEDEYEFLQAQMACQNLHGTSGIRRMLCTCDKLHMENPTRRLLCVSRIADKVVKVANDHGEARIAAKIYRGSVRCRSARYGITGSHDCLVKLLEERSGEKSKLHLKHGRNILTNEAENNQKVDALLSKEMVRAEDFTNFDISAKSRAESWPVCRSALTFLLYVIGIGYLVVCLLDLSQQYRRHTADYGSDGRLSRLPAQAQALYARLTLRS